MTNEDFLNALRQQLRHPLREAEKWAHDPLGHVMAFQSGTPKYLLENGRLIGLNLAGMGLDDAKWESLVERKDFPAGELQALNLSGNQLSAFKLDAKLQGLRRVDLSENQLREFALPPGFDGLERLGLEENPNLISPSPEIVQQGEGAVLVFLKGLQKDVAAGRPPVYLKEVKILIVGEGQAGKTTLLKQFRDLKFEDHESQTHGVNVEVLNFEKLKFWANCRQLAGAKGRFWDFGGQEIMHASHQFFLTERSLYILVVDSRTKDVNADYWLRYIETFGGDSPTIVAMSKIGDNPTFTLPERELNERFPFVGNRFFKIDCKTGKGLDALRDCVADTIPTMKRFKEPVPANWLDVKNELEKATAADRYIDKQTFRRICADHEVADETEQNILLEFLNDLGIVLHFKQIRRNNIYVLDPHWVTVGVYRIINSACIQNGVLKQEQLDYILNHEKQKRDEEYDPNRDKKIQYSSDEQLYLVEIMEQFELLFELRKNKEWLIPDLLPKEAEEEPIFDTTQALNFVLRYDFLPPALMSRFFVEMKEHLTDRRYLWSTGAVLESKQHSCSALVRANRERREISISVNGQNQKREYFTLIRETLAKISRSFSGLKIERLMPVPGHPNELVDYDELLGKERMGEDKLVMGKLGITLSVKKDFLDKIPNPEERKQMPEPEKKKPWYLKWWTVLLAMLAILANIAQAFGINFGQICTDLWHRVLEWVS